MNSEIELEKLEDALVRAGRSVAYPTTPSITARVRAELLSAPRHSLPHWAVAAVMAIIVASGLLIAFPAARDALAQVLGLRTVRIIFVTQTPMITPTPTAIPLSTQTPALRVQCCETTLANARAQAKFKILLPPTDSPTRVYLQNLLYFGYAQQVVLVFGSLNAPRFTLFQATNILYGKMLAVYGTGGEGGTIITETTVNGHRALWLSGAPHVLVYLDANGQPQFTMERTVNANTLAWEIDSVTYRLETHTSEAEAIRFAESLR